MQNSIKYIAAAATVATVEAQTAPLQYTLTINNMTPAVTANIQAQGNAQFNIETNSANNMAWVDSCEQKVGASNYVSCSAPPTDATLALQESTLTGVGADFVDVIQGGYDVDGRIVTGTVDLLQADGTTVSTSSQDIYTVRTIVDDGWHYDQTVNAGAISLAITGASIVDLQDTAASTSGFLMESGPIVDQSFAGGSAPLATPLLYIGQGDYSALYDTTEVNQLILTPEEDGSYALADVGFGKLTLEAGAAKTGYFQGLGYTNQTASALIAPNFVGFGLPEIYWYQVINLLYKIQPELSSNLVCDDENGGKCTITGSCSAQSALQDFSFRIDFADQVNYVNVPLGAFAVENNGNCDLYLQYLNQNQHPQSDKVILGAMFLQTVQAYWQYDIAGNTTQLSMSMSASNTLTGFYLGAAQYTDIADPFTDLHGTTQTMYVTTDDYYYRTTIGADLGWQGQKQFTVSLLGNYVQSWSQSCYQKFSGQMFRPCSSSPVNAIEYFDDTFYFNQTDPYEIGQSNYGGFETSGYIYNATVCATVSTSGYFCTTENADFYIADSIYNDNWNYGTDAYAGNFGLGYSSPIWTILGSQATRNFDVYMTCFNDWTFADSSYVRTTLNSVITLGGFSSDYSTSEAHTSIKPTFAGGSLFAMKSFGFGLTDTTATPNTQYYSTLLNSNETVYGAAANAAALEMNYRGLGLPTNEFKQFTNLLNIASNGEATCLDFKGGYCLLANPCDYYTDKGLWDYDFKIQFDSADDNNYIRVPLASFAANYKVENDLCVIFVEYLQDTFDDSQQIIFGGMFFQSVYAQYSITQYTQSVDLYVNKNALPTTYIGLADLDEGTNPFMPHDLALKTDDTSERNGVPTFAATITGVSDSFQYYLMDFNADHTLVWQQDCMQTGVGNYVPGPCEGAPTLASSAFNATTGNDTGLLIASGIFANTQFGGYVVSGTRYTSKMCLNSGSCKLLLVYAANEISQDNWRFKSDATYGILGMGPNSAFWNGFATSDTLTATYSVALAKVQGFSSVHAEPKVQASTVATNITFGAAAADMYAAMDSVTVNAMSNYSYALNNFGFGIVYQESGVDSSQFFVELETMYPVEFSINFKGLGLPANLYLQVSQLLADLTDGDVSCDNSLDGICTLPAPCANYSGFTDYTFMFNFTEATSNNYMRVPLGAFAENVKSSGGDATCNIEITYLNDLAKQSSNIILGGLFFQEFFGVFTNDYTFDPVAQMVQLYPGLNAQYNAYIGNEALPEGVNPFVPPTPTPADDGKSNVAWIIVLSVLVVLLLGGLGFAIYKWKTAQQEKAAVGEILSEEKKPLTNNFSEDI